MQPPLLTHSVSDFRKASTAVKGKNAYAAWWTNKTVGNDEIVFRASTVNGSTFGDNMKLGNTTNVEPVDAQLTQVVTIWLGHGGSETKHPMGLWQGKHQCCGDLWSTAATAATVAERDNRE
jgi:hypothetical protein